MNYKSISLISGTLLLSTLSANGQKKDSKPNIIFILCDDMGYGDLGCYGQPFIRTPHIDAMASEGMRFTQAYAGSPVSAPSRASFMTGQHTGHCEVRGNKEYWGNSPIIMYGNNKEYSVVGQHPYDPDHVILPEIMKDNGYTTGMFGKWAGGYEGSCSTPDKRGIDEYYGYICQFQAHLYYPNFLNRYSKALGDTGVVRIVMDENIKYPMYGPEYQKRSQYSADMIHEKAMEWLDQQDTKQPFFGIFTYTLPHAELVQPEDSILNEYKAKFDPDKVYKGSKGSRYNAITHTHAQFAAMITRLDYYVGEFLKKLKGRKRYMNSISMKLNADKLIMQALEEDITSEDITTNAVMRHPQQGEVQLLCKQDGVIAGLDVFKRVFELLDETTEVVFYVKDGDAVKKGDLLAVVKGDIRVLLSGERTALNYLQRMSGIATYTRSIADLLKGSKTKLLDTRKTTPNNRIFEKYAVKVGGGYNHRYNLSDGVLLKDNHIGAAGGVKEAVTMAKEYAPFVRKIEVEVENLDMVREAVEAGADIIMLDNMTPEMMKEAVRIIDGRAETECSGNVTLENVARLTDIGVDYISSGALTHSAPILDVSLKNLHAV